MISYDICLSLSDLLSMTISRSIHVAANGIISFFLWLILHIFLLVWDQEYLRNLYCLMENDKYMASVVVIIDVP